MTRPVRVLGIAVGDDVLAQWRGWLLPDEQPYVVPRAVAEDLGLVDEPDRLTMELQDSFWLYAPGDDAVVWLTRTGARRLPAGVRRDQPAPHRWPTSDAARDVARVVRFVEEGRRPSRHEEVSSWSGLPAARPLAGTFADRSGPNCFGTVMAAAGVAGAEREWMQREPFEEFLRSRTRPGGRDDEPGTVLVWRNASGAVDHAAVTLGDGWALHKPSQGWMSPTKVLAVRDAKLSARSPGRHLERRRLT
jgi:hypothetical protein